MKTNFAYYLSKFTVLSLIPLLVGCMCYKGDNYSKGILPDQENILSDYADYTSTQDAIRNENTPCIDEDNIIDDDGSVFSQKNGLKDESSQYSMLSDLGIVDDDLIEESHQEDSFVSVSKADELFESNQYPIFNDSPFQYEGELYIFPDE